MGQLESFFALVDRVYRTPKAILEDLDVQVKHVISLEGDAKRQVQEAVSSGKKPKRAAKIWMRTAKGLIMESKEVREEASRMGWIAQIVNIPIKRRMEELIKQLGDLSDGRVLQDGLILDRRLKFHTPGPGKMAGLAFVSHFNQIWAWLVQDGVLSIGIYGLGGVGKTTLAKCLFNKALPIQNVLWIDSSQIVDVRDLQVAIAKPLHLDVSDVDDEAARATLLSKTLKRKRECIVFLDGMCNDISLEDAGIPLKKSRCRLIVTSRSVDVPRKMGCEKIIEMKPLVKEEDWSLFMETLGGGRDLDPEIQRIAKSIAKKCSGIPLALIVVATSMRGVVDIYEWKNALNELEKSPMGGLNNDMEKKVLPVLKLSFDRLNNSELQQCFLMCALFQPKGASIIYEELIYYLISTGSIRRMHNWKADFERGCTIINRLVGSCLLTKVYFGFSNDLSMNDLIRDMAINVLKTSPDMMVKVSEIPEEKEWTENLKMAACLFLDHRISSQLGASPTCSKLRTLVCRGKQLSYIPDSFFMYMPALEILDLSYTDIECMPSSFSSLKNLTTLLLKGCSRLKYVPSLKEMESLKFIDASQSGIIEVPDGLERLVNLIYLNLSDTVIQVFPLGILPKLTKLEYLRVSDYLTVEGRELEGLERLSTFYGRLSSLHSYNSYVMSRQYHGPKEYKFKMGRGGEEVEEVEEVSEYDTVTFVKNCRISKRGRLPIVLPKDVESLNLSDCGAVTSLCDVPSLENAMDLQKCSINRCNDVSHVACFSSSCHFCRSHIFQTLERLSLVSLPHLSAIFGFDDINGKASTPVIIAPGTFSCLKDFTISDCPKMKILFQPELLPYLQNLEEIAVYDCERLEGIIEAASSNNCPYSLPKLTYLKLGGLPNLKSIFKGRITCDALEDIEIRNCPELKRIPLTPPPSSLKSITVEDCERLEEIIEAASSSSNNCQYSLPKLTYLKLRRLPNLKSIFKGRITCDALEDIEIRNCPELKRIPLSPPPSSLRSIIVSGEEWWESVEWDSSSSTAKNHLQHLLHFEDDLAQFGDDLPWIEDVLAQF